MSAKFVKIRDSARNAIKRYLAASNTEAKLKSDFELVQSQLGLLKEQWSRFNQAQDEVEMSCGPETQQGEEKERIQTETWYMEALANLNRIAKSLAPPLLPTPQSTSAQAVPSQSAAAVSLPKIQLPIFEGDHTEWITFHDTFMSLVDSNRGLSDTQKMHYLRSCLRGEALQLVNNLKVSDVNYEEAWNLLKNRYRSLRVIVTHHFISISAIEQAAYDSADDIKKVFDTISQHVKALKALGRPVGFWDDWLVYMVVSKLAYETRKQWELSLTNDDLPTFEDLQSFLEKRCRSLGMLPSTAPVQQQAMPSSKKPTKSTNVLHANTSNTRTFKKSDDHDKCWFCNDKHKIYVCTKFSQLDANERLKTVKQKNACLNCLSKSHFAASCRSASTCRICRMRHHTMLHISSTAPLTSHVLNASLESTHDTQNTFTIASVPAQPASGSLTSAQHASSSSANTFTPAYYASPASSAQTALKTIPSQNVGANNAILLATALVRVLDTSGRWQPARVLFDSGSHATFATESCIQRLGISRTSNSIDISGIGSSNGLKTRGEATITISSRNSELRTTINTQILSKITNDLPTSKLQTFSWPHIQNLLLADPHFNQPGPIDILLGMDEMDKFILTNMRKGKPGTPIAQETTLGWVLFGRAGHFEKTAGSVQSLHCDTKLVHTLAKFWELEELPPKNHLTAEELYCEDLFNRTHERAPDGRFIVQLPFKPHVKLGESKNIAVRSLLHMEKRLAANEDLCLQYHAFMKELIDMHHMEVVSDIPERCFYIPHHAVVKATSITTKLRVVFNASAKSTSGSSFNDALMVGPQLQRDLFAVLLRFRSHRYAMTADVEKMYRQVRVSSKHHDYQRIVWRANTAEPIRDYRMLRVTYGVASASHLAVKALQQTACTDDPTLKDAAAAILSDFYMDDLLTGTSNVIALNSLQQNIAKLLSSGGFELRKWATNCKQLHASLPNRSQNVSQYIAADEEVRTLGLVWNTEQDFLTFTVCLKPPALLTKRAFLSEASMIFDPLGFVAPCTIRSKIWFQQIWNTNVDWDESVPSNIAMAWSVHREDLKSLSSLKLTRWLGTGLSGSHTELHVFADASQLAYAAVIYMRTFDVKGHVTTSFVTAKAKVAPLKTTRLPRLELCAAHLAAKLIRSVISCFDRFVFQLHAWTDSTVTLAWLQGHPSRWSTFVANRVADIQEVLPAECWNHVRSQDNPADCASRGVSPTELLNHQLWWQGPQWLRDLSISSKKTSDDQYHTDLELRASKVNVHVAQAEETWELLDRYSSYGKLKRVTAYLLRFINNLRAKRSNAALRNGLLTFEDLSAAEYSLVKYSQNCSLSKEIKCCNDQRPIPRRSNLVRLAPFLDEYGLLRAGGRIARAKLAVDQKFPILLPKKSPLAILIISDIHRFTLHSGPQSMLAILLRRFWVIDARNLVRKVYRNCFKCQLLNRRPQQQFMGDFPRSRVTFVRCFLRSAVDFAGPYSFKFAPGRGSKSLKGYICSFICMSTGAMHLEFVGGLSSKDFINAFKRFINRRGFCYHMYSDNGTNFVGADRELRQVLQQCLADPATNTYFQESSITWHFNPPSAPHMGGYWEVGIKRVKYHLKRTLGDMLLTFEEFSTLLTEVEACVNSRPLCSNESADVDDLDALTPGHFILGEPLKSLPTPDLQEFDGNIRQRFQAISAIRQYFWRRWRDEYLKSLQKRTKWFRESPNVCEDDVVVIIDEHTPPTKWKLARVLKCHPGTDGRVRVVSLKTADGECLRPIAKLCLLPTKRDLYD